MTVAMIHFNHQHAHHLTGWADMRTSKWKPNYGDILVCSAILRQLDIDDPYFVNFGGILGVPVERAMIRGSTYLHAQFDFDGANATLDSIDAPVAIVGLGAQHPVLDVGYLDHHAGARGFIARLNEKAKSISVRGAFSAEVVSRLGGKNIRITGCPSLFHSLKAPRISIRARLHSPERKIGVSLHSGLSEGIFCRSSRQAHQRQAQLIAWTLRHAAKVELFEQGVTVEYDIADENLSMDERRAAAIKFIQSIGAENMLSPEDIIPNMVSVKSIEEWLARTGKLDANIGFRFHGNMVALLQGNPCLFYTYDSRLKEFCDLYHLPQQDVAEEFSDPVDKMTQHNWNKTNMTIAVLLANLEGYYRENGFETRFQNNAARAARPAWTGAGSLSPACASRVGAR